MNYLNTLNLRDIIVNKPDEMVEDIRKKYNDFKIIQSKPLLTLINEFLLASKYRKIDILSLLLMSNDNDKKLAFVLYDIFKTKDKKDISKEIYNSLHYSLREQLNVGKNLNLKDEKRINELDSSDIPYERRISLMKTNDTIKSKAMEKLRSIK